MLTKCEAVIGLNWYDCVIDATVTCACVQLIVQQNKWKSHNIINLDIFRIKYLHKNVNLWKKNSTRCFLQWPIAIKILSGDSIPR